MCEAVVEGMGGVWDRVATDRRNVGFDCGVMESVLAWNAPQPYHPAAEAFIARSLDHLFGGIARSLDHLFGGEGTSGRSTSPTTITTTSSEPWARGW